tara:strand:+ start:1530 stop:1802 length:273 start_codon:yes stop_codon:yes gene_type:complete
MFNDTELLKLIIPALPKKLRVQLKTVMEAKDAIRDAKEAIRQSQFGIATEMHKITSGESTNSLPKGVARNVEDEIRFKNRSENKSLTIQD